MVTLASQDSSWYSGWQLLTISRDTISGSLDKGAASIVVELNQAAGGATGIAIKPGYHVCEYIFDRYFRLAGGICAGAYSYPGPQIPSDSGHNANSSSSCRSRSSIADYFRALWTRAGLEQLDPRYESAAHTLRASEFYTFRRVVLPLIRPILLTGAGLAWARALGELGATITFAGSFPGITETMPVAVYTAAEVDLESAVALSVVLLAISFAVLITLRVGQRRIGIL